MRHIGLLESIARADLDALVRHTADRYWAGALDALAVRDPGWLRELDRAEREVGALLQALSEADAALGEWRRAVAHLARLWDRVHDARAPEPAGPGVAEVA